MCKFPLASAFLDYLDESDFCYRNYRLPSKLEECLCAAVCVINSGRVIWFGTESMWG